MKVLEMPRTALRLAFASPEETTVKMEEKDSNDWHSCWSFTILVADMMKAVASFSVTGDGRTNSHWSQRNC